MNTITIIALASLLTPIIWALINLFFKNDFLGSLRVNSFVHFVLMIAGVYVFMNFSLVNYSVFSLDNLNKIFYLLILITSFIVNFYSIYYFKNEVEHGKIESTQVREYLFYINIFISAMLLISLTNNFVVMWIGLEATTISTVFLVSFYGEQKNWESAWKYIIICGIGVTLGLFGILTILYAFEGSRDKLLDYRFYENFDPSLLFNKNLIYLGFIFTFIGFATKVGIFPMNTWLPDAHSKAPTPVSAFLSSIILPLSLYILFKLKLAIDIIIGNSNFTEILFISFGVITLIHCGIVMLFQFHYKRALAYSSSENMAIAMIALGLSSVSPIFTVIGLFHIIAHAFIKQGAFMTVGNMIQNYQSGNIKNISELPKYMKYTSFFVILFIAMLTGIPPSPLFFTEIILILKIFTYNPYIAFAIIFGLVLAFTGLLTNFGKGFGIKDSIKIPFEKIHTEQKLTCNHYAIIISGILSFFSLAFIPYLYQLLIK